MELNKEFKAESLNIEGYSIIEVSRKRARSEKFKAQADLEFDPDRLADAAKVYAYVNKEKKVKAIYPIDKEEGDIYSLEERLLSDSIKEDPVVAKMDEQVKFLLAQKASYYTNCKAVFLGEKLPKLKQKSGGFNIAMAIVFGMLYSTVFWQVMGGPSGIGVGICLGVCMGFCFAEHSYYYEGPKEEDNKEESA